MDRNDASVRHILATVTEARALDRRAFVRGFAAISALAGMGLAGCGTDAPTAAQPTATALPLPASRLRAAYSHNGLGTIWNQRGRDTAQMLGKLLGIDVVSYDGELNIDKQRQDLAEIADQNWDFVVIHPLAVNAYTEQVRQIVAHGTPVIDIDTRLADNLDDLGVTTFLEPDNVWMGEQVTRAIIKAVQSDTFEIIHTQGLLTHTGAQGRAQGFRNVLANYPGIRVVDETPGNWDVDYVTQLWDDLLVRFPNVRAGFFHNDEMALAALRSIQKAGRQGRIAVGGVDGMQEACAAVERGDMVATVLNPTGRIHGGALWAGYFRATQGASAAIPKFIRIDGGVVNAENAPGYIWMGDHLLL